MPEPTEATADKTAEGAGQNTEGAATGAGTQTAKTEDADKKFTQADLDRIAAKTRKEEREKLEKEQAEAEQKRNEEEAKKQGEFEKLYTELKPQHEAQTAELNKYKDAVKASAEAELNALPDEVKDIAPSLDDPLDVLAWLPKGKALAAKLDGTPAKPGAKADPKARSAPGDAERDKQARAEARRAYRE